MTGTIVDIFHHKCEIILVRIEQIFESHIFQIYIFIYKNMY